MTRLLKQFFFGIRVFFQRLTLKNLKKIIIFIFKRYLRQEPVPFSVVLAITYHCQCRCVHCSVGDYAISKDELSTQELKQIIDAIDTWGPIKITFFGGEPLLRKDVVELVAYASAKGIRTSLDTNGVNLTEPVIEKLKSAGIGNINVSIDSADPAIHDRLRKYQGCFDAALNAIRLCVRDNISCLVSTYASNRSVRERDLEKIVALARQEKASGVKILFPILSGRWRTKDNEALTEDGKKYLRSLLDPSYVYIEDALEMVKHEGKGCSAIEKNLVYISPSGDVQPCPAIPVRFGNVREEPLLQIVHKMMSHAFYTKHKSCSACLMNDEAFRKQYFATKGKEGQPLDVRDLA